MTEIGCGPQSLKYLFTTWAFKKQKLLTAGHLKAS